MKKKVAERIKGIDEVNETTESFNTDKSSN